MPRLMLNGKLPSKEELLTDDLVIQMIDEAKTEALKTAPTKESVIQSLTIEDIKDHEAIKQIQKDVPTKETILQSLTVEDVPETVKQKIIEDSKVIPPAIENLIKQMTTVAQEQRGVVAGNVEKKDSVSMAEYKILGGR